MDCRCTDQEIEVGNRLTEPPQPHFLLGVNIKNFNGRENGQRVTKQFDFLLAFFMAVTVFGSKLQFRKSNNKREPLKIDSLRPLHNLCAPCG